MVESAFRVWKSDGNLQLTNIGGYSMGLSNYGQVTLSGGSGGGLLPVWTGSVTVSGAYPVLALEASALTTIYNTVRSGSNTTFYLKAQSSSQPTVSWWSFDIPSQALKESTAAVMRSWDDLGNLTFDLAAWPFIVVGDYTVQRPGVDFAYSGGGMEDLASATPPSGRRWALVQSTPGLMQERYTDDLAWDANYPFTTCEDYYEAMGGRMDGSSTLFFGQGKAASYRTGANSAVSLTFSTKGQTRFTVVDVTHFPSPGSGGPSPVQVGQNATERSVSGGGAASVTTTTPTVTINVVGGVAPYTILWERLSGSTDVAANGATDGLTFSTTSAAQAAGSTKSAVWRAKVTDANGAFGYSANITFSHTVAAYSNTVTAWTTWPNQSGSTTSNYLGFGSLPAITITGPTGAVVLRFQVSNYSGNLAAIGLYVEKNGAAFSNMRPDQSPSGYIEVAVAAGDTVRVWTDGQTLEGAKSGGFRLTVTNQTAGGTPTLSTTNFTFNVDTDDDYNRIAKWTTANQVRSSTAEYYGTAIPDRTISGIVSGSPRTIRLTMTGLTGNVVANGLYLYKNGVGTPVASWANGRTVEISVANGDVVGVYADASTGDGTRSGSFTLTLTDQSDGAVISTWTNSITVDSDNSTYVDATPDAITWSNVSGSTASEYQNLSTGYKTVSGINTTITIRATITAVTGNVATNLRGLYMWNNNGTYDFKSGWTVGQSVEKTFTNGQSIGINTDANTDSGIKSGSVTVAITNVNTGASMGSITFTHTVDSDNSTAPADYTLDSIDWPNVSNAATVADSITWSSPASGYRYLSGINRTINMRAKITSFTGDASKLWADLHLYREGFSGGPLTTTGSFGLNSQMTWTATNGQGFFFGSYIGSANAGRQAGSCTISIYNDSVSTTTPIDTFTVSWDVDTDGSTAPADYTPDSISWSGSSFTTTSNYDGRTAGSRTISGINQTITLRASISSQGGNGQMNAAGLYLIKNGSSLGGIEWIGNPSGTVSGTFVNGDTVDLNVDMQSWGAYRATANCTVTLFNVTTGLTVATWTVSGTVFSNKPNA